MRRSGFSLVELSIVLVILGLLTGGVLTGQNLIRAAELRSVTTEFNNYQTAVMTFRDKYFAVPGDMNNATDFWDVLSTGVCPSGSGSGTETCSGNGDGIVDEAPGNDRFGERYSFWQHLANAGLIEGSYTGKSGTSWHVDSDPGENVPASKISNAGWDVFNRVGGSAEKYDLNYGNHFSYGVKFSSTRGMYAPVFSPEEAWGIDKKIDDGVPGRGRVIARYWDNACAKASSDTDYDAPYNLSDTSLQCSLYFLGGF